MSAYPTGSLSPILAEQPLAVALRREAGGPQIALEPVRPADLVELVSEAWRDACLRQGHPGTPLGAVPVRLSPRFDDSSAGRCTGFVLELTLPDGQRREREFSLQSLREVAARAADPLIARGELTLGQPYYYELVVDFAAPPVADPQAALAPAPCTVTVKHLPLSFLRLSLRSLLEQAAPVDLEEEEVFPVFFTAAALAQAEACARRGAEAANPIETGGVLIGPLAACEVSNEFFVIVTDVLPAQEAEATAFSLSYTAESWSRITAIMRARQAACPHRAERLLGQCHGHNFLPNDGKVCDQCDKRPACGLTSVFVSRDDQKWMRAVFARQPWSLSLIFGLSARGEPVSRLFSLRDGRWLPRGYYLLPNLNAEPWTV